MKYKITLLFVAFCMIAANAQDLPHFTRPKDSVFMSKKYPFILPIMGDKVHKLGIRLPFPVGVMVNAVGVNQELEISDLSIGFGNRNNAGLPNMISLNDIVTFERIKAKTSTYNMRVDAWLLPFLDVYGLFGVTKDSDLNINIIDPLPLTFQTNTQGTYIGFGVMAAGAVGPVFVSLDTSQSWSFNPRLDDPVRLTVFGFRAGPVFKFPKRPHANITFWTGAMYATFDGQTIGEINTSDLIQDAPGKIGNLIAELDNWYESLSPVQQILYKGPYELIGGGLEDLQEGINDTYIRYDMNKTVPKEWNMVAGMQYQINYHWQLRSEVQFLGSRTSAMLSLNYRFGIRGKNWLSH